MEFTLKAWILLTALISVKGQSCPAGSIYMSSSGKCLITKTSPLNWKDAQAQCKSEATNAGYDASIGNLVNVQNEEMQIQVKSMAINYIQTKPQTTTVMGFWLGAFETSIEGATEPSNSLPEWAWIKGCPSCSSISDFKTFGQGCYSTSNSGIDVTQDLPGALTITTCTNECRSRSYPYALLRMGTNCYCSNSYAKDFPRNDCGSLCAGDRKSNCGGPTADYVYYVNGAYNRWDANKPDRAGDVSTSYQYCGKINKGWDTWKLDDFSCGEQLPSLCELPLSGCGSDRSFLNTNGRCYMFDSTVRNWWNARVNCKSKGGDLAVLDSVAVHDAVQQFMISLGSYTDAWVGLTAKPFYWTDGQDLLYNNFTTYHPNRNDEECIIMNADEFRTSDISSWSDGVCGDFHPYVCEILINPPTTTPKVDMTTSTMTTSKTSISNSVTSDTNNGGSNGSGSNGSNDGGSNAGGGSNTGSNTGGSTGTPAPSTGGNQNTGGSTGSQTSTPAPGSSNNNQNTGDQTSGSNNTPTTVSGSNGGSNTGGSGGSNTGGSTGGSNNGGSSGITTPAPTSGNQNGGGSTGGSNTGGSGSNPGGSNTGSNTAVTSSPTKNTNNDNNNQGDLTTAASNNGGITTASKSGTTASSGNGSGGNGSGGNGSGGNGATTAANNNGNNNNGNNNGNTGNNSGVPGQPAASTEREGLGTFEIVIIVVICLLLLAIIIAIVLFVKYKKNNGNNSRVQPEKSYDARGGAPNPDSEEIYIPPSETGSTSHLIRP